MQSEQPPRAVHRADAQPAARRLREALARGHHGAVVAMPAEQRGGLPALTAEGQDVAA